MKEYYDFLEQHIDGGWWYHPHYGNNFDTKAEAENAFKESFMFDLERPHLIIRHKNKFPDYTSLFTMDFVHFTNRYGDTTGYTDITVENALAYF